MKSKWELETQESLKKEYDEFINGLVQKENQDNDRGKVTQYKQFEKETEKRILELASRGPDLNLDLLKNQLGLSSTEELKEQLKFILGGMKTILTMPEEHITKLLRLDRRYLEYIVNIIPERSEYIQKESLEIMLLILKHIVQIRNDFYSCTLINAANDALLQLASLCTKKVSYLMGVLNIQYVDVKIVESQKKIIASHSENKRKNTMSAECRKVSLLIKQITEKHPILTWQLTRPKSFQEDKRQKGFGNQQKEQEGQTEQFQKPQEKEVVPQFGRNRPKTAAPKETEEEKAKRLKNEKERLKKEKAKIRKKNQREHKEEAKETVFPLDTNDKSSNPEKRGRTQQQEQSESGQQKFLHLNRSASVQTNLQGQQTRQQLPKQIFDNIKKQSIEPLEQNMKELSKRREELKAQLIKASQAIQRQWEKQSKHPSQPNYVSKNELRARTPSLGRQDMVLSRFGGGGLTGTHQATEHDPALDRFQQQYVSDRNNANQNYSFQFSFSKQEKKKDISFDKSFL